MRLSINLIQFSYIPSPDQFQGLIQNQHFVAKQGYAFPQRIPKAHVTGYDEICSKYNIVNKLSGPTSMAARFVPEGPGSQGKGFFPDGSAF